MSLAFTRDAFLMVAVCWYPGQLDGVPPVAGGVMTVMLEMLSVMVASISSSASALVQSGPFSQVSKSVPKQPWPCEVKLKFTEPLICTVAHGFQLIICF